MEARREHSHTAEHTQQQGNPHVWLDPVLAQDICRRIAQAFIQVDPGHKQDYENNLAAYLAKLEDLHEEISKKVATFRQRDYVCFHPAFAYFARRYGIREVGVIEAAPGREPSPGHLQKTITAIKKCGCRAVFAEPQLSPRVAEVIAQEAGVKVLFLDLGTSIICIGPDGLPRRPCRNLLVHFSKYPSFGYLCILCTKDQEEISKRIYPSTVYQTQAW